MEQNLIKMEPAGQERVSGYRLGKTEGIKEKTGATAEQIRKAVEVVGFDRAKVEEYIKSHSHQS